MPINITYRVSEEQAEIAPVEIVNKGKPLRNVEIDGNFKSIKQAIDNIELSGSTSISINPIYNLAATTIQEALEELSSGVTDLATELTDLSSGVQEVKNIIEGNVGDYGSGAGSGFIAPKPATTITINPIPGIQSSGVQGALEELSSGKQQALVSGSNIKTVTSGGSGIDLLGSGELVFKTINNESILGSGNISITGGATGVTSTFKTINNQSIIGTGDIVISGSIDDTATDGELYKTWSADKIFDSIAAAKQAVKEEILGGATGAYDTLQELYDVMNGAGTGSMTGSGADITTAVVTNLASKENAITPKSTGYLRWDSGANSGTGAWEFKNETLLNSTNIKTINNTTMMSSSGDTNLPLRSIAGYSIIGTGDIAVAALLDDVTSSGSTWSSTKISSEITTSVNSAMSGITVSPGTGGGGGGGDVTKTGTETLTNKTIQGLVEMSVNLDQLPLVSDRTKFNLNNGNLFIKQIDAATIFTVVNPTATGTALSFIVELRNTQTTPPSITWMPNTRWAGGTVPTLTAKTTGSYAIDIFGFYSFDNGSTWRGLVLAKNVW